MVVSAIMVLSVSISSAQRCSYSDLFPHIQASLKKFMDYIQTSAVDKMVKFMDKGLDPNFQDSDTGGKE